MTDESTENEGATATDTEEPAASAASEGESASETAAETAEDAAADHGASDAHEHEHHGDADAHPYRERYLIPFLMPLGVVTVVIAYIVSVSRIFLSSHGHAAVIAGTIITAGILLGAAALSAAPKMRSGMVGLASAGFFVVILMGGWLTVGHAEPEEAGGGTLDPNVYSQKIETSSSQDLRYSPPDLSVSTGLVQITLKNLGGEHTLNFDDAATEFANLHVTKADEAPAAVAFFEKAGDYSFYCAIPGHRAAGMEGVITATGNPQTLESAQAQAESSNVDKGETSTSAP